MDPRRLLTFRTVAHERSFSRAAETLSLSQPSVSHQVALLETEIGVRLLDRGRGGLRLTHAGEVLLEHADHVAWRLQLADAQITQLAEERRDQVRLGAFPTALAGFVPSAIARLRLAHRDLRILLSEVTASTRTPSGSTCSKKPSSWACHQSIGSLPRPAQSHWRSSPRTTGSCRPPRASSFRPAATPASTPASC